MSLMRKRRLSNLKLGRKKNCVWCSVLVKSMKVVEPFEETREGKGDEANW